MSGGGCCASPGAPCGCAAGCAGAPPKSEPLVPPKPPRPSADEAAGCCAGAPPKSEAPGAPSWKGLAAVCEGAAPPKSEPARRGAARAARARGLSAGSAGAGEG